LHHSRKVKFLHPAAVALLLVTSLGLMSCEQRGRRGSSPAASPAQDTAAAATTPPDTAASDPTPAAQGPAEQTAMRDRVPANEPPLSLRGPQFREVTIPAGTTVRLRLETPVASDASSIEDPVRATLRQAVIVDRVEVLPSGTPFSGAVTAAQRSGKVKGRAFVAFRLTELTLDDEQYDVRTAAISRRARATKAKDAKTIGIPAAGGAIVGGIIGGKKGAAIGGAAGGGAGTAVVLSTRGQEVRLPAGASIDTRFSEPITIRVPVTR
jgi:hypothetical protein